MRRLAGLAVVSLVPMLLAGPAYAAPPAPSITSPLEGQVFCDGTSTIPITGTAASGSTVAVRTLPDATTIAGATAASDSSWATEAVLRNGTYSIDAVASDGDGESPPSPAVSFTVAIVERLASLSLSTAAISPGNRDGYRDAVTASVEARSEGEVRFEILAGENLRKVSAWTARAPGELHSFVWNGTDQSGARVPTGVYRFVARFRDANCTASLERPIRVDNLAPKIAALSSSLTTVYPRTDDQLTRFRDSAALRYAGLTERARVRALIYPSGSSTVVRALDLGWRVPGSGSVTWNGRASSGRMVPAGAYEYAFELKDPTGNKRRSLRKRINVSHKRLVSRTVDLRKRGSGYATGGASGCGQGSVPDSAFADGLYLYVLDCNWDDVVPDAVAASYSFRLPSSVHYHSVRLGVRGFSTQGSSLYGLLERADRSDVEVVGAAGGSGIALRWFGSKPAKRFVRSGRVTGQLLLFSPCDCRAEDYDIAGVTLRVVYGILR